MGFEVNAITEGKATVATPAFISISRWLLKTASLHREWELPIPEGPYLRLRAIFIALKMFSNQWRTCPFRVCINLEVPGRLPPLLPTAALWRGAEPRLLTGCPPTL